MKNLKECPLCGGNCNFESQQIELKGLDGVFFSAPQIFYRCENCHESITDEEASEAIQKEAKQSYHKNKLVTLVESISSKFKSISSVERSLGLPMRSFNRWKHEGTSTTGFLLTKFVDSMPFLVEIASGNFDDDVRDAVILRESELAFQRLAQKSSLTTHVMAHSFNGRCHVVYSAANLDESSLVETGGDGFTMHEFIQNYNKQGVG